ncbi:DUF1799 domain-containing protein [Bowmanella denitrificans]|uniref:DUF1799 domain-containing protein n=1 Tax=Bowmanella denitrificans TaxID=366582 RepID=UPI000C9C3AE1|nr:DUF1799 domain-containing protein [Bowmanella denitrificans]
MKALGAPQELIDQQATAQAGPDIQPGNLLTVRLFYAVSTQWLTAGMAGTRTGLNYPAIDVRAMRMPDYQALPIELKDAVWRGLQVMELAALAAWSSQEG